MDGFNVDEILPIPLYKQKTLTDEYWNLLVDEYSELRLENTERTCNSIAWIPHRNSYR